MFFLFLPLLFPPHDAVVALSSTVSLLLRLLSAFVVVLIVVGVLVPESFVSSVRVAVEVVYDVF